MIMHSLFLCFALTLSLTILTTTPSTCSTDKHSLLAFKNAITSDPHAVLTHNWSPTTSLCNWTGVSCSNKHHRVTALNVSRFHFRGTISQHLANLTFLQSLDISHNNFTGPIPSELSNLRHLEVINLRDNEITGAIPNGMFNMSSLVEINMRYNRISGELPNDMCSNSTGKLKRIYLSGNQLYGEIPASIYKCSELEDLLLPENYFSGNLPEEIGSLQKLTILSLRFNYLQGFIPDSIFNLSALKILLLSRNQFSGTLHSKTFSLYNLEELYLYNNRFSGKIPSFITSNASKLTILGLGNNSFTGPMPNFGNLRFLQRLEIWRNRLTGSQSPPQELEFISSLTNCRYLIYLDVSANPLNGILPTTIGNFTTSLQLFNARKCNISGVIPPEIGNLSSLIGLDLYGNQMTGSIPGRMGNLKKLQGLDLSNNQLLGNISIELCEMSDLGDLDLSGNMLTGPIPDCLGEVTSLRNVNLESNKLEFILPPDLWGLRDLLTLNLSSNGLSGQLSSQVGNLKAMYQLDLSRNQFSGDIPSSIGDCQSLEFLSLSSNKFGGSIPQTLENVRGLKILSLSYNDLSGSIPKSFEDLPVLEHLDVSYNKLEGEIPNGIANSTPQCFVHNPALCGAPRFQVSPCAKRSRSNGIVPTLLKYILPLLVVATIVVVVVFMLIRRRKQSAIPPADCISLDNAFWRRISYVELERGTSSFSESNILGRGSFGSVFKATLSDGLNVAVKVFHLESQGATKSFDTETEILSSIRHRNLVRVIGCCTNQDFKALILEYMPNESLDKWLYSDIYVPDLVQRLNIASDVALALEYLHHGHTFPVVHCDVKPSNVLLDEDMTAHVGDFGISKLFNAGEAMTHTTTLATIGYAAPEYGSEGKISTNGDVYSYGILLLEMFTGKKPTDDMFCEETSLKDWASDGLQENAVSEIAAPGLLSTEDQHFSVKEQCVSSIFDLAMKCLPFSPNERINMQQVVPLLHKIKAKVTAATKDKNG